MTPLAITTAWAIKTPAGKIYLETIRDHQANTIAWYCVVTGRMRLEKGYHCVKVQITEMEEGK